MVKAVSDASELSKAKKEGMVLVLCFAHHRCPKKEGTWLGMQKLAQESKSKDPTAPKKRNQPEKRVGAGPTSRYTTCTNTHF
jgi:hypothetical protein